MRIKLFVLLGLLWGGGLWAQVNYTALDRVDASQTYYGYGSNSGYFPPHNNTITSNLAAGNPAQNVPGAGCRSYRSTLPDNHLTTWGTSVDLSSWQHYDQLGMKNNVAFVGYPHSSHQDTSIYCPSRNAQSGMFRGLYEPIWDGGLNGTPVNDSNLYALYLWQTVNVYKPYVKYWEIWNEPDFENGQYGWRPPSDTLSWWNRDDFGCELVRFNGTIYEYIRLLRISWEVIKTADSTAHITTGGIGYEAFLDAILRNTDNPLDGSVTATYPLSGGAYFDVLSYHVYPEFEPETRYYSLSQGGWVDRRHSDGAAEGVIGKKQRFETVLFNRGFDGQTYPQKRWIITEHNIGRRYFGNAVGGEETQRNYQIKSPVLQQLNGIEQGYVYGLAEVTPLVSAGSTFDLMGLYSTLSNLPAYSQPLNESGVANKTLQMLLYGSQADTARTHALNLPAGVEGGAFVDSSGIYTYVLWAQTAIDRSELASATYSFPASLGIGTLVQRDWNHSATGNQSTVSPNNLTLTGDPVFLTASAVLPVELLDFYAEVKEGPSVRLSWYTSKEEDNDFFTVERSVDGLLFEALMQIPGSPSAGDYEAFDRQPLPGKSFYRLRQTDVDGRATYFPKVEVFVDQRGSLHMEVFPNPVAENQALQVLCRVPLHQEDAHLVLQDFSGRTVMRASETLSSGTHKLEFSLQGIAPGGYFLLLQSGSEMQAKKVWVGR